MTERDILEILERAKVVLTGHFVYASGQHGRQYINKDRLSMYPHMLQPLAYGLACRSPTGTDAPQVVAATAVGAICLGHQVALHLRHNPLSLFAEKKGDTFVFQRGYDREIRSKRVLVVEDILTTGGSARRMVEAVHAAGGRVVGLMALWNRGGVRAADVGLDDITPFTCLLQLPLDQWPADQCPLCLQGVPVNTDVGHGARFLESRSRS